MNSNPRTATFLFTDLENSTPLWENHPELTQALSSRHDALIKEAIESHRGQVVKATGDGFHDRVSAKFPNTNKKLMNVEAPGHFPLLENVQDSLLCRLIVGM